MKLAIPEEVSVKKVTLGTDNIAFVFRHKKLGDLGRLLILPHHSGQTQLNIEVSGSPNDPMTKKRQDILEPIVKNLTGEIDIIYGQSSNEETVLYDSPAEQHRIASEITPCDHCGKPAAMLIIASTATTQDSLEDIFRLMYEPTQQLNVPTWVIGQENEVQLNGKMTRQVLIMKVHPSREKSTLVSPGACQRK